METKKKKKRVIYDVRENEILMPNKMIRKIDKVYNVDEVLPKIQEGRVNFDGDMIKMNSLRYHTFAKGLKCKCGLVGQYFVKERNIAVEGYHFNLYAIDGDGKEVLMTKDHIMPKSKGGKDSISNFETMCITCNMLKGDSYEEVS